MPEWEDSQLYLVTLFSSNSKEPIWMQEKLRCGAGGLQGWIQSASWWGSWVWIQPFPHPPTQPLVVTTGLFQVWFSICAHHIVLVKCSWKHDCEGGVQARKTFGPCLRGTQDLKAAETSCFHNRCHLSHGASPYLSPNINKLSPWKGESWGIIES